MNSYYKAAPLLDGWGASGPFYDHRYIGYDKAPKKSLYLTARPLGPYLKNLEPIADPNIDIGDIIADDGLSSDDDDDDDDFEDEDYDLEVYGHVDLNKTLGQQLAVWCHRMPETLAIFTPVPGDTLFSAVNFAKNTLHCDTSQDRVLVLSPDQRDIVDPSTLYYVKPGSSILVVPRYEYVLTLEVTQLDLKLEVVVNLTMTVRSLKEYLHKERGFHVDRTDLLYRDEPMENQRHLFDYRVSHGTTMFAMLHLVYDMKVQVETFWGARYELYADPCMTTACLLKKVLRRTITAKAGDAASYFHLALPRHALVMYTEEGVAMKWSGCLGLYKVTEGAVISLSTIALAHQMSLQTIPVLIHGKVHNFRMSKFDYWSVLALKVHGLKGYPVNLIRLFHGKRELDQARAAGPYSHKSPAVLLDTSLLRTDEDVYNGVDFNFKLGSSIVEVIQCSPARSVRSVKSLLEDLGVPNATAYDFFVDGYRLPTQGRIGDVVEEHRKPIDLKLRQYPVFVHGPKSVIYKMNVHAQEAFKVFKARVEMKTGLSQNDYYLLMAGLPIEDKDSTPVFRTHLVINCSVFLMPVRNKQTFLVVADDWLVKLRLPFHPSPSEIKNILWKDRNIPEGSLASVGNFLQWYYSMKASNKGLLDDTKQDTERDLRSGRQRQSRPKKRRDREEDAELRKYNAIQMKQLQHELDKRELRKVNLREQQRQRDHHNRHNDNKDRHGRREQPPVLYAKPPRRPQRRKVEEEKPGIYYARDNDTHWRRLNPEDLANEYLRACSMPPDPAVKVRDLHEQQQRLRKYHSAMADLPRKRSLGNIKKKEPQWVHSLRRLSREEEMPPAVAGVSKRKKHKKRRRDKTY